jgi:hypothetical protein
MEEVAARTDRGGTTTWVASNRADGRGTAESGGRLGWLAESCGPLRDLGTDTVAT